MSEVYHLVDRFGLWIIPLGFLVWWLIRLPVRFKALDIMQTAPAGIGRVVEVSHTQNYRGANPRLLTTITLDVVMGGPEGRVKTLRTCTLDAMPRAGDLMVFRFDPRKPGQAFTSPFSVAPSPNLSPIAPEVLRALAVATIISVSPPVGGARVVGLEIDAIGAPKRRVRTAPLTAAQIRALKKGWRLAPGDRVYVRVDPNDPDTVGILPPSMTGGGDLARDGNRLDGLVSRRIDYDGLVDS